LKPITLKTACTLTLVIGAMLTAGPLLAGQPDWAGKGRRDEQRNERRDEQRSEGRDRDGPSRGNRPHFEERHSALVRDYYTEEFRSNRRCPPGLAKKRNGCLPPGQVKKWQVGRPLPRDVVYYEVPQPLVMQIGAPPPGYRYVRVSSDILMIAIGTGLVVDGIRNLGR
jgi:Ni/Co efflux regulator RcnB